MSLFNTCIINSARSMKNIFNLTPILCVKSYKTNVQNGKSYNSVDNTGYTLQERFLKFISNLTFKNIDSNIIFSNPDILKNSADLKSDDNISLYKRLSSLALNKTTSDKSNYHLSINSINNECTARLRCMNNSEILSLLNGFGCACPERLKDLSFYKNSIMILWNDLDNLKREELVQLIFYIGHQKRDVDAQKLLKKCIDRLNPFLREMTLDELCIVCSSFFKTSTKIKNIRFHILISKFLKANIETMNDSAYFITLIKNMRHNKYYDYQLLNKISNYIKNGKVSDTYSFTALTHLLILYADSLYYDPDVTKLIVNGCVKEIQKDSVVTYKKEHFSKRVRIKDISSFLWALSYLGCEEYNDEIDNYFVPHLHKRSNDNEFVNESIMLLDTVLALWTLKIRETKLLKVLLQPEHITQIYDSFNVRNKSRLELLFTILQIEAPELYNELNVKRIANICSNIGRKWWMKNRRSAPLIANELKNLSSEFNLEKIINENQIQVINLSGFSVYNKSGKKIVNVEFFDIDVCLKNANKDVPYGLMKLKLRLLEQSNEPIIIVPQRLIKRKEKLQEFFRTQLKYIAS